MLRWLRKLGRIEKVTGKNVQKYGRRPRTCPVRRMKISETSGQQTRPNWQTRIEENGAAIRQDGHGERTIVIIGP
jgi:hypothetical protein